MTIIKTPDCTLLHVRSFYFIVYKVTMACDFAIALLYHEMY